MRIVVAGNIVADTIEHEHGGVTESLGGIAHTVAALSALAGDEHTIVPLCRVGEDCRERIESWAGGLDGVSLDAVVRAHGPQPTVRLTYGDSGRPGERVERLQHTPEPLDVDDLDAAVGADAVVVNCITGSDLTPAALRRLRRASPRRYMDVHSLALGTRADGTRFYRGRDDWAAWLGFADVLQCNLAEAATMCGMAVGGADGDGIIAAAEALFATGFVPEEGRACVREAEPGNRGREGVPMPGVWLLTLGSAGAVLLSRRQGRATRAAIPAPAVRATDPTGAGDAFGAGYVCAWLEGYEPREAAERAVIAGAAACIRPGAPEPATFRDAVDDLTGC